MSEKEDEKAHEIFSYMLYMSEKTTIGLSLKELETFFHYDLNNGLIKFKIINNIIEKSVEFVDVTIKWEIFKEQIKTIIFRFKEYEYLRLRVSDEILSLIVLAISRLLFTKLTIHKCICSPSCCICICDYQL